MRNNKEVAKWYLKAAEQGVKQAQYRLGLMYDRGRGVTQDYVRAHAWFNLAASHDYKLARDREAARGRRDEVATRMTPEQIAEAQSLAREWAAKYIKE